jgi:Cu(I)/Ag(I) efflux system membrane fusion protein/cobalt-zinc-cadmium efflux system membrane fusion protein
MSKYIWRTSLVWLGVLGLIIGFVLYRRQRHPDGPAAPSNVQPVAGGPAVAAAVELTPESMRNIGMTTGVVERKQIQDEILATGSVAIDERRISYVQVRFRGYIRQVFVSATYQFVHKNEPLFTIYSPDLAATERDYLNALDAEKRLSTSTVEGVVAGAKELTAAAAARLRQWEVPEAEIAKLEKNGAPPLDLAIDSPVSGYVTERNALPNLYVEPSTRLYTVADLSRVWVYAQVFQDDAGRVRPGQGALITVDTYPGRRFAARVESVLPDVDLATRTVRVRLELANPGIALKPGMFVNVALRSSLGKQLTAPASAVLHSGTRNLVFVSAGNGRFEPKEVTLGPRSGDDYVITGGLKEGQRIVTSANFLVDSESQIQAAAGSYTPPPPGAGRTSESRQATISFTTTPNPPRKGGNVFHAKILDSKGEPLDGADVTATFFMPAMPAMGMAAMTATTKLAGKGNGLYEGAGTLASGGTWQVTIVARKDGEDVVTRQLRFNATDGM